MHYTGHSQAPSKGTIIVDSCALFDLMGKIPDEYLEGGECGNGHQKMMIKGDTCPRALGLLSFLSNNGYHVVIPDMVLYEAAMMLPSGYKIRKIAFGDSTLSDQALEAFLSDAVLPFGDPDKHYPGITVEKTKLSDDAAFLGQISAALKTLRTEHPHLHHTNIDRGKQLLLNNFRRTVTKLDKENSGQHLGDDAIVELATRYKNAYVTAAKPMNVFVLTNDTGLRGSLKNVFSNDAHSVSTRMFYTAMEHCGLNRYSGLKCPLNQLPDMEKAIATNVRSMSQHGVTFGNVPFQPQTIAKQYANCAIFKAFNDFAKDLAHGQQTTAETAEPITPSPASRRDPTFWARARRPTPVTQR